MKEEARAPCSCLVRQKPSLPEELPFEPKMENVGRMNKWILDRYASSTLKCTHKRLTLIDAEPIKIAIDPKAKPVVVKNPAPVPLHFKEEVKKGLMEDVSMGILEKVPMGEKTTWQHRMHVVSKPDGRPRRTVDLRSLNKVCRRDAHFVNPPYKQAREIPRRQLKTATDAWNGYHSCPLDVESQPLTTFVTEWGRFRYATSPQGYMASGDGYNARFDKIIEEVERKTKCVDNVALWDEESDVAGHWWQVLKFLNLVGQNGVTLNPEKFQFCREEILFAGFVITKEEVKPPTKILESIRKFNHPTNISEGGPEVLVRLDQSSVALQRYQQRDGGF